MTDTDTPTRGPAAGRPPPPGRRPEQPPRGAPAGRAGPGTPAAPMDPRIRQRRVDVRREEGRRRLRIVAGCAGVVAAALVAVGLGRSPLFDVDYVDVRGAEHTARGDVLATGRLTGHPALVDVDTAAVARRVEALPWVLEARARRQWPGTVRIDITERRPLAVVPAGGGQWALADRSGRVLAVGPDKPAGVPVIGNVPVPGPPGSSLGADARVALRVAARLPEGLYPRVADVAVVADGEVDLQLAGDGGWVKLGRPVDVAHKLDVLVTVLARADLTRLAQIDVRVPAAPTLTRR